MNDHSASSRPMSENPNQGKDFVTVYYDEDPRPLHRGSHTVSELRQFFGVPDTKALDVAEDGQLVELADDGRFTIKGGEHFFSKARTGASS